MKNKMTEKEWEKCIREINEYRGSKVPMLAMEESGEFIQAISKMERYEKDPDILMQNLVDEIGDMYICLGMIEKYYKVPREAINIRINEKAHRRYN